MAHLAAIWLLFCNAWTTACQHCFAHLVITWVGMSWHVLDPHLCKGGQAFRKKPYFPGINNEVTIDSHWNFYRFLISKWHHLHHHHHHHSTWNGSTLQPFTPFHGSPGNSIPAALQPILHGHRSKVMGKSRASKKKNVSFFFFYFSDSDRNWWKFILMKVYFDEVHLDDAFVRFFQTRFCCCCFTLCVFFGLKGPEDWSLSVCCV